MLPLVDNPSFSTAWRKPSRPVATRSLLLPARQERIEDHFDVSYELEKMLEEKGKHDLLKIVRQISDMIYVSYVGRKSAGLGHAVLTARELIGDEPFATLLADDVIDAKVPVLKQMMKCSRKQCP